MLSPYIIIGNGAWTLPANVVVDIEAEFVVQYCAGHNGMPLMTIEHAHATAGFVQKDANLVVDCSKWSRRRIREFAMRHVYWALHESRLTKTLLTLLPHLVPLDGASASSTKPMSTVKTGAATLTTATSLGAAAKTAPIAASVSASPAMIAAHAESTGTGTRVGRRGARL